MTDLERLRDFVKYLYDNYILEKGFNKLEEIMYRHGLLLNDSHGLMSLTSVVTGEKDKKISRTSAQNALVAATAFNLLMERLNGN